MHVEKEMQHPSQNVFDASGISAEERTVYLLVINALHVYSNVVFFLQNLLDGKTLFSFKQSFVVIDSRVTWQ